MKSTWCVRAYAKVNFNLKVLPKREDGFHNIESIFQTIGLYDELIVTVNNEQGCKVICNSMQLPKDNTLILAYNQFCSIVNVKVPGITVELIKNIPSGAGLGGGSSDAGALIRVLQKICKITLTESQKDYIASKTGSDVFFFVHCNNKGKGCALVSGRGEYVQKIKPRKDLYLLLFFPGIHSSTKEAYALVDKLIEEKGLGEYPLFTQLKKVYYLNPKAWNFRNTFSIVLEEKYSIIRQAIEVFIQNGAVFSAMSGSGSTVFGVYTSKSKAKKSKNLLSGLWSFKLVRTI